MPPAPSDFNLRLVGLPDASNGEPWRAMQNAKLAVMKENRLAAHVSGLDPGDPRLLLAAQTHSRLQGAMLTPERRAQLLKAGRELGMRPFESSLVIAVMQDRARAEPAVDDAVLPANFPTTVPADPESVVWPRWFAAIAAALVVAGLLLRWLTSL